jgi:hypothetical protein
MSEIMGNKPRRAKRSLALPVVIAGGVSSLLLAFSLTPTFSALTASIQNSVNTAGVGTLIMQESDGTYTCNSTDGGNVSTNSATCASINKYGGDLAMVPGKVATTNITIKNTGTVPATSFSLVPGTCAQSTNGTANGTATDLCAKINVVVKSGSATVYTGTAAGLSANLNLLTLLSKTSVAAGESVPFVITATVDSNAGNTYQGLKVSQTMTWNFGA